MTAETQLVIEHRAVVMFNKETLIEKGFDSY